MSFDVYVHNEALAKWSALRGNFASFEEARGYAIGHAGDVARLRTFVSYVVIGPTGRDKHEVLRGLSR